MKLRPLADGRPAEDLGIAHLLKHWCNPVEMWEDIANGVPDGVRPRAVLRRLDGELEPWLSTPSSRAALAPHWEHLRSAYRLGYAAYVVTLALPLPDPPGPSWSPDRRRGVSVCTPGAGVILMAQRDRMYTAFRPVDFKIRDYDCPPRDSASVNIRREMAVVMARKYLHRHGRRTRRTP